MQGYLVFFFLMILALFSENLDLMNKLQDLEDKLSLEEEAHTAASFEVSRLRGIENQVLGFVVYWMNKDDLRWQQLCIFSSQRQAQRAKDAQEQAEKEREVGFYYYQYGTKN